jgi:predicted nuclease with TOPRIM domain
VVCGEFKWEYQIERSSETLDPKSDCVKASKPLQEKLEALFKALEFKVRYEKGSFKSGYCIIEDQNVVVINKFFPMESKVNALVEILRQIEVDESKLDEPSRKLLHKVRQTEITL